jgi:hypothetical protein
VIFLDFDRSERHCAAAAFRGSNSDMLPDEQPSPEQIEIFRRMTPEQRWRAAHRLYWTMRRHKSAFLHSQHPDWSAQRLKVEVRNIFLHARS